MLHHHARRRDMDKNIGGECARGQHAAHRGNHQTSAYHLPFLLGSGATAIPLAFLSASVPMDAGRARQVVNVT
jgi:hypothetical protein